MGHSSECEFYNCKSHPILFYFIVFLMWSFIRMDSFQYQTKRLTPESPLLLVKGKLEMILYDLFMSQIRNWASRKGNELLFITQIIHWFNKYLLPLLRCKDNYYPKAETPKLNTKLIGIRVRTKTSGIHGGYLTHLEAVKKGWAIWVGAGVYADTSLVSAGEKANVQGDRKLWAMAWWLETACFHELEILNRP